jgi:tripartite-type tricarboxylate transporter receptor subunit TctC
LFSILPAQKDKLSFDVNQSFVQIGMITGGSVFLVAVSPALGIETFAEFGKLAKQRPYQLALGTNGAGTLPHFIGLAIQKKGDLPITIVPYNQGGTMAAVADTLGGRIHGTIEGAAGLRGHVQSGSLKVIGQLAHERVSEFPAIPAVSETIPGLSASGFLTLAGPAKTPETVVQKLSEGLSAALRSEAVTQRYSELGASIRIMSASETRSFIEGEQKTWWPIVKELTPPS